MWRWDALVNVFHTYTIDPDLAHPSILYIMSHGPPTPPPTGAAELMDHEKDAAAPVPDATTTTTAPAASGSAATIDPYHRALPTIADLVSQHNYSEVIRVAELAELNVRSGRHAHASSPLSITIVIDRMKATIAQPVY
jgi:hypothetical protein